MARDFLRQEAYPESVEPGEFSPANDRSVGVKDTPFVTADKHEGGSLYDYNPRDTIR